MAPAVNVMMYRAWRVHACEVGNLIEAGQEIWKTQKLYCMGLSCYPTEVIVTDVLFSPWRTFPSSMFSPTPGQPLVKTRSNNNTQIEEITNKK